MYLDNGYWMIWFSNNSRTQLHRWLMEQFLGKKLSNNEVVHHKNGITTDNRLENLEVQSRSQHTKNHKTKPFYEVYEKRKCKRCGKEFVAIKRYLRSKWRKTPYIFCGRSCGAKDQWERGSVGRRFKRSNLRSGLTGSDAAL